MAGRFALLVVAMFGIATLASAQTDASVKIGILPFADATASGNRTAGVDVGRTMQSEITHSTTLIPRTLEPEGTKIDDLDGEKAVAIGREQHVDLVFMGTVLDATSQESNKSGWMPSIKGQSASVNLHRVKASVTLQGELYDVASGKRLFSVRVTGTDSNNAWGGTAYTSYGAWGNDGYNAFLDSPMGKALQRALADMTKQIAAKASSHN